MIGTRVMVLARQVRDGAGRIAADEEKSVEGAVLQLFAGRAGLEVFRLDVLFRHAIGVEHEARIDDGAGTWLVEGDALALQVGDRLDAGVGARDQMDGFGIERRDEAQVLHLGLALIEASARLRPVGDVGLREA